MRPARPILGTAPLAPVTFSLGVTVDPTKNNFGVAPNDAGPLWMGLRLVSPHSENAYQNVTYPKGAYVLQMLRSLNFAVGIFLAGLSGVLAAGQLGLEPTMGTGLLMPSFIAIIVGGIGSLPGTLVGGLLIGVASGLTAVFLPAASEAVIYVLMAVVLLLRPRGLFGEEGMMS